jgi:hypothetical protein
LAGASGLHWVIYAALLIIGGTVVALGAVWLGLALLATLALLWKLEHA